MAVSNIGCLLLMIVATLESKPIDQYIKDAVANSVHGEHEPTTKSSEIEVELDMKFTLEDWSQITNQHQRHKRKAWRDVIRRWPHRVIPYTVQNFTPANLTELNAAIQEWETYTCLDFRPATSSDRSRLLIKDGRGCDSFVGMQTQQPQEMLLANGCRLKRIISHELGHVIGFIHEQSRPDRDSYVDIKYSNMVPNTADYLQKFPDSLINTYNIPYDYKSLMHYGEKFLSMNDEATIITKDASMQVVIGEARGLSFRDIKAANLMYGCNENCSTDISCTGEGFIGPDCKCWYPGNPVKYEPPSCMQNFSVYLPLDHDFDDKSCGQIDTCAVGNPTLSTVGLNRVTSFDGNSYLELNMGTQGNNVHQMTIFVRFKVSSVPPNFAAILSNGEIDTRPTIDVHINNANQIVAGINGVYFKEHQATTTWTSVKIIFNKTTMAFYVNGLLKESKNTNGDSVQNTELPLRIGGGSNGSEDGYLHGYIDKVEISEEVI